MTGACILVLDNLRSVENTASIFRTAEGLGASKIILVGTTPAPLDRFGRKRADFAKVSLGSEDMMEWEYVKDIKEALAGLKSEDFHLVSLEQHPKAVKLREYQAPERLALIVGSEVEGVSEDALKASEAIVEIDMMGMKESLNVSVATGVALFKLLN